MSWSRASLLSMEKSGSSGASGRWGKAMAAVAGWKSRRVEQGGRLLLRSEEAGSGPGKRRMALLQVRAQNPKKPPKGPSLVSHTGGMNGRPPLSQTAAAKGTLLQACSHGIPPRPSRSTPPVRRMRIYTCRDTKERGGLLDLPEVPYSRAPLRVPGKGRRPGRDI